MQWRQIRGRQAHARIGGEVVALPPLWTSSSGYQVAVVDVRSQGQGWALWRRRRGGAGWVRCVPTMRLDDAEARDVAELDQLRRRTLRGLPFRLLVAAVRLGRPALARIPLEQLGAALDRHLAPDHARRVALVARYLHAITEPPRQVRATKPSRNEAANG